MLLALGTECMLAISRCSSAPLLWPTPWMGPSLGISQASGDLCNVAIQSWKLCTGHKCLSRAVCGI